MGNACRRTEPTPRAPPRVDGARPKRRDLVAAGVRLAATVVMADGVVRDKRGDFAEYAEAAGTQLKPSRLGWARRPGRGETYGETFIKPFYAEIAALYQRGNVDKNTKVSPDQVREQLRRSHPGKFCIPGVWALQNEFIALGQKKTAEEEDGVPKRARRGRGSALPADVLRAIDELLVADAAAKPAAVLASLLARVDVDPSLHLKVKARVSQAKSLLKKREESL